MPSFFEHVGELADFAVQHFVGVDADVARLALPDDGGLVPPGGVQMGVEAVVGDVGLPADEPLGERLVPLEDLRVGLEPMEFMAHLAPKAFEVAGRLLPELLVLFQRADAGLGGELLGGRKQPRFLHHVDDLPRFCLCHQ